MKNLNKYYWKHLWVTEPNSEGKSFLGLTQTALKYFLRISKLSYLEHFKTCYGIENNYRIEQFLREYVKLEEVQKGVEMEYERFCLKRGEPFCTMQTMEFDVELQAPVTMRVCGMHTDVSYFRKFLTADYYFEVEVLKPEELLLLHES